MKSLQICGFVVFLLVCANPVLPQEELNSNELAKMSKVAKPDGAEGSQREARMVRAAYAKLSLLDTAERVGKIVRKGEKVLAADRNPSLVFSIRDVRQGEIDEIRRYRYWDLVTPPNRQILQVMEGTTKQGTEEAASVRTQWVPGQYSSGFDPQWTIDDILQLEAVRFSGFSRFAAYKVTASLNGLSRAYNALALFRPNGKIEILDNITGMNGVLNRILKERRLPLGMKRVTSQNSLRSSEQLTCIEWEFFPDPPLIDRADGPNPTNEDGGYWQCLEWAYSPVSGSGDPPPGGGAPCPVKRNIDNLVTQNHREKSYHTGDGAHEVVSQFRGLCTQDTACRTGCEVELVNYSGGDFAPSLDVIYSHIYASSFTTRIESGPQNTDIECETAVGYAWKRCLVCSVEASLTVSGKGQNATATTSGGDLWNASHIVGRICRNGQ